MNYMNSDAFYFGWGWLLWVGFIILMFSSFGNWGYTYRAHRKVDGSLSRDAASILSARYASGELTRAQYLEMRSDIIGA
jgi:putative membrane protein